MPTFVLHEDAEADLDALYETDEEVADDLTVLIGEIGGDEHFLTAMRTHQAVHGRVQVSRLLKFEIWGRSLWRLRICELSDQQQVLPYRLIYACHGDFIYLLALMHRDRNYEQDAGLVTRITSVCRQLGIPTHL